MATTTMDYENTNGDRFEDEPRYERDRERSASPRPRDDADGGRRRSASPATGSDHKLKDDMKDDDGAINPGSNLFVTGIAPSLREPEVTRLFEKYGEVEKCQIMRDPHTKESRGFGFVKMVNSDQADAAKEGLQGEIIEGRSLCIEKARRARPRTPTPGKYFGPPKRERDSRQRFDDRRRGGGGYRYRGDEYESHGGRDDRHGRPYDRGYRDDRDRYDRPYDRGGYRDDRHERRYDGGYRERGHRDDGRDEAYGDRYAAGINGRGDRYGSRGGSGGGGGYDRDGPRDRDARRSREPLSGNAGYGESAPRSEAREAYGGSHY